MSQISGKELATIIANRKDQEKAVRQHTQSEMFGVAIGPQPHYVACARNCGMFSGFHKPENVGRHSSRGIVYDGHAFEGKR